MDLKTIGSLGRFNFGTLNFRQAAAQELLRTQKLFRRPSVALWKPKFIFSMYTRYTASRALQIR